jgi:hypothetical protein
MCTMRAGVMVLIGLAGAGCYVHPRNIGMTGEWATALNRSLYYLPFVANGACGEGGADSRRLAAPNTIRLLPGMKLVIHWTNAGVPRTGVEDDKGNAQPPVIASYEWVVPEHGDGARYASADFFMLVELLTAWSAPHAGGDPPAPKNLLTKLHEKMSSLKGEAFEAQVASQIMCPVVSSLRLSSSGESATRGAPACTAQAVRELLGPGSDRELEGQASRQTLSFANPLEDGCPLTDVFAGTPPYFDRPAKAVDPALNAYLRKSAVPNPTYLEPMIAVRIEPEMMSRHVPMYWSVDDLERRLGVRVIAVRRRIDLLGRLETDARRLDCVGWHAAAKQDACGACGTAAPVPVPVSSPDSGLCEELASPTGYATLYVRPRRLKDTKGFGAMAVLRIADFDLDAQDRARKTMLLAHGDVIITERARDTDVPGAR